MDGYLLILCLGFGGLLLMCVLGLGHHQASGQNAAHGGHAAGGQAHGHGPGPGPGHHAGPAAGHHHAAAAAARAHGLKTRGGHSVKGGRSLGLLLTLISPRVIFSLLLGFGAAGVLLHPLSAQWPFFLLPLLAAFCAWVFEWYAVQPLWRVLFGFASAPARTLESIVLEEGQAVTNFDAAGCGLIAVDLDGQVRQLLGNLAPEERAGGERIRSGDRVFIRAVDPRRNSCTVSRLN